MPSKVYVVGLGMSKFVKPNDDVDYPEFTSEAINLCLKDSGINYKQVDHGVCCYVYGDSCCGQNVLYDIGLTGIPILNVNNNCATGSTGLYMGHNLVKSGASKCCLVVGFEKMQKGALESVFRDRANPLQRHVETMSENCGFESAPVLAQLFGNAGREHIQKYGTTAEHFAKVAHKNHQHSLKNPKAQFQKGFSLEEIKNAPMIFHPLTRYQCCPPSNGAAAVLLIGDEFLDKNPHLKEKIVQILDVVLHTDNEDSFHSRSAMDLVGYSMTKRAANQLYFNTGLAAHDFQVVELHDCFSANELITYEALQLCGEGKAGNFIDSGYKNKLGIPVLINPSGGLLSKGHPLGATGLAQCVELCNRLRNKNAEYALQHNLGLGGAVVLAAYRSCSQSEPKRRVNARL